MDIDNDQPVVASNVDQWLALFSPATSKPSTFPFTPHKIHSIESRRARMSDLLIFDVLLTRGGIRAPDMYFPPPDSSALRKLFDAIDSSVYDVLKKDCLVYIIFKWAWDFDTKDTNAGWETRFIQDRCIPPQFSQLADAYWLLDTGTHLAKAVSMLSDARLNRDYVSKILQALALSSSPASFANGTTPATAALVVKYVRTAKPLLTEPDDIDLYALSLAQLFFADAWAYQKSFPEESETRERLLRKIVGWCLMPKPKQAPLAQLLAFPLSPYEESFLHKLALPSSPSLPSTASQAVSNSLGPVLSLQAISILQDLLCVRAIQSGDCIRAIKLDRQFSSSSPPGFGNGPSSSNVASNVSRETINRKAIIQDLFTSLPPAERALLEDDIGKVATGVRASLSHVLTPKKGPPAPPPARRPALGDLSMSTSWDDLGASTRSPAPASVMPSIAMSKGAPMAKVGQPSSASPFTAGAPGPSFPPAQQAPTSKFTAFGTPIPPVGTSGGTGVISEKGKTLFSSTGGLSGSVGPKPVARTSLFETTGSAKTAPNAFYKPPPLPATRLPLEIGSSLVNSNTAAGPAIGASARPQNGKTEGEKDAGDDISMHSESDIEIVEEGSQERSDVEEHDEEGATEEEGEEDAGNFITSDMSRAADLTLHPRHDDDIMGDDQGAGPELGFSVFNGSGSVVQNGSARTSARQNGRGHGGPSYIPTASAGRLSPPRKADKSLNVSASSSTTGRRRAPPGAFHAESDDQDESEEESASDEEEAKVHAPQRTPVTSPPRITRTRTQTQTPSRPPARSQPRRESKSTAGTIIAAAVGRPVTRTKRMSGKLSAPNMNQSIPGSLVDDEDEEEADHTDPHGEQDSEDEEEDALAPLPSRSARRTTRSGVFGTSTRSQSSAQSNSKSAATSTKQSTSAAAKGKAKARPSEVRTPTRRSSRLSTTSSVASLSPDHTEEAAQASPTKGKARKSVGGKTSAAGSGATATRSSTRRKR